jgi:hypothetical protein
VKCNLASILLEERSEVCVMERLVNDVLQSNSMYCVFCFSTFKFVQHCFVLT